MLVSVLIPAYNSEKHISYTIDSVLNQTWQDIEVIIVNDGSTDKTPYIVDSYQNEKIVLINKSNGGVCSARNTALKHARGRFIQWLDADDILDKEKISAQMEIALQMKNESIVYTGAMSTFFWKTTNAKPVRNSLCEDLQPNEWLIRKFRDNAWLNPSSWLISRELTLKAGPWDESLLRDNDGEYICRVVSKAEFVKFVSPSRSYYRIGNFSSITRSLPLEKVLSVCSSTEKSIEYLLHIDESRQAKDAATAFIVHRMRYVYPEFPDLIEKLNALAQKLGTKKHIEPKMSKSFLILSSFVGYKWAKKIKGILWDIKLFLKRELDKLM